MKAHDDCLTAPILKEIAHRISQCALHPQPAKHTLKIGIAVDRHRLVHRPALGATDKRGDGSGNAGNGAYTASDLFDVNPRMGRCDWHSHSPSAINSKG